MTDRPLLALAVRVGIALGTRTFFQPDEFFQSLEVAHHAVFGYGQLTWEWRAESPIRSIVYPGWNIPVYWALKALHLDHTNALVGRSCEYSRWTKCTHTFAVDLVSEVTAWCDCRRY